MRRPVVIALVMVGVVAIAFTIAMLIHHQDQLGFVPPDPASGEESIAPDPSSRPAPPRRLDSRLDPESQPVERSPEQLTLARALSDLVGVRDALIRRDLAPNEIAELKRTLSAFEARHRALEQERMTAGAKRAEEVYAAGGWTVFPQRTITIPHPGKPGQTLTRNAAPEDDKVEDEFISETGAEDPPGVPQTRVVRLRPDTDSIWAAAVASHKAKLAELRAELRQAIAPYVSR